MLLEMFLSKILASMVLQNYQKLIKMTSNAISIVIFIGGLKCPRKIHFNTQWGVGKCSPVPLVLPALDVGDAE